MQRALRDLYPSLRGRSLLARYTDGELELVDGLTLRTRSRFAATIDLTGAAAIDDAGEVCIVSIWERHGIARYDPATGAVIWRRKDLKKFQELHLTSDAAQVCCGRIEGSAVILDTLTGEIRQTLPGVAAIWTSPYGDVSLLEHRNGRFELRECGALLASLKQPEKDLLSAAFSPDSVAYSKVAGATWCIDARTAQPRWMYTPPLGCHILELAYRPDTDAFFGIELAFDHEARLRGFHPNGCRLLRFRSDGDADVVPIEPGHAPMHFASGGQRVVCCSGAAFDTATGRPVGTIIPQTPPPTATTGPSAPS
jgi:hypothetical protein